MKTMRRCFGCGVKTSADQLTKVGDGEFCAACFDQLLASEGPAAAEPVAERKLPAASGHAQAAPTSSVAREAGCLACGQPLREGEGAAFLGGDICPRCAAEMKAELRRVETPEVAPPEERQPHTKPPAHLFTPGAGATPCAGCDRPMPGPGSYRKLGGQPYCAACLPFFAQRGEQERRRPAQGSAGASCADERVADSGVAGGSAAPAAASHRPSHCECCSRPLGPGLEPTSGFWLCPACTGSDGPRALSIARARHVRRMQTLQRRSMEEDA